MKKQTAVEWLIKILEGQKDDPFTFDEWMIAFEQAKQMEKQQIEKANKCGFKDGYLYANGKEWKFDTPDQYYNETFKSE